MSPPDWVTWDYTASSADDQPGSQGPHNQVCRWPAQELGITQPALLMTSPGVKDHTINSADDQPITQGPHSQLCWGPARESGTTQPTLLMTSLESGTTQLALLRTSPGVRDHTANSTEDQTGSQGPHSQLCYGPAQESWTTQPTLLRNSLGVRDHSPLVWSTHWRMKVILR